MSELFIYVDRSLVMWSDENVPAFLLLVFINIFKDYIQPLWPRDALLTSFIPECNILDSGCVEVLYHSNYNNTLLKSLEPITRMRDSFVDPEIDVNISHGTDYS